MPWESAAAEDRLAAGVVFNLPLDTVFYYVVPDELREVVGPGQRVRAPFGKGGQPTTGFCVEVGSPATSRPLKALDAVLDREPLLSPRMLKLTHWIAERYLCGWGQVLHAVVPAGVKKKSGTRLVTAFMPARGVCGRIESLDLPHKQRAVLEVLCREQRPLAIDELSDAADCGTGPVNALRDKGLVTAVRQRTDARGSDLEPVETIRDLTLNEDQRLALEAIMRALREGRHETVLLHGVTGSGKTEVYIQAIREVVDYGRQAVVLVPEISLTPQTIRRFRSRFPSVAVLHSHLSDAERHWHWQQIARGEIQVVVGARSAVFAPTPHLGLIVIDEEHETTFKQETTPRYHTREVARRRAELESVPLVLGSATPTLESWLRVERGHDRLIGLPRRVEGLPLPPVVIVDVRNDPWIARGLAIGRALETALRRALDDEGQAILFLNLRGYSPALWCRACGNSVKCPHCDVTLTWHRDRKVALCHFCEHETPSLSRCPGCGSPGIRYMGIGTQKLEEEVRRRFPGVGVVRMDSDTMRRPGSHDVALESFRTGKVQILLGTQMIAKGLDFPNVTLVGVIDADTLLHQPDLRASERTFQLISQVAGRTGRSRRGGRVFVQSANPAEPAILRAAEHDYRGFVAVELEHRRRLGVPPFTHLARVIVRGPRERLVSEQADAMVEILRREAHGPEPVGFDEQIRLLGPAPAPVTRLKGQYRYHFQIAAAEFEPIHDLWQRALPHFQAMRDVEFTVDVDPVNMR
ncbi:MAG: primosomal protein N' [Planctomycetes bacterium]|nr:primosomal protein N' [Planctomycetota bacterium]